MNKTKLKLIKAALKSFNEEGVVNSTNQEIAKAAGVSLSNFNYYFKTKKDLVVDVCNYMCEVLEEQVYGKQILFDNSQGLHILKSFFEFKLAFQFFYLDTPSILKSFPDLHEQVLFQINKAIQLIKNLNYMYIGMGRMKPEPVDFPGLYDHLAEQIWMTNHFWMAQSYIRKISDNFVENGIKHCFSITYPYLTETGIEGYKAFMKSEFDT